MQACLQAWCRPLCSVFSLIFVFVCFVWLTVDRPVVFFAGRDFNIWTCSVLHSVSNRLDHLIDLCETLKLNFDFLFSAGMSSIVPMRISCKWTPTL